LNIICVSQRFYPVIGGAERTLEKYMDSLSKNHDVTVYTANALSLESFWNSQTKKIENISTKNYDIKRYDVLTPGEIPSDLYDLPLSVSSPGPFCPDMWNDLLKMENKSDLIVTSAFPYDHIIPAFVASKKHKIPLITIPFLHLEYPEYYLTGLKITLLSESNAIVVNTKHEKDTLLNLNIDNSKIHLIPPGIEIDAITESNSNFRQRLDVSQDSLTILFVGNMSVEKGVITLIESLKSLWSKSEDIQLVLIGSSTHIFDEYIKKQKTKFLKNIRQLGIVTEKEKLEAFDSCDIFVMPSKTESFGLVYLESWKYKKPVIGCNIPAVSDLIDDGINGILVDYGNISQLTNSIKKLTDSDLRLRMGESGYQKLITKYDINKQCEEFEKLCVSLI
jgi:glycosyltransferase involved in cell wall biosynthesis